MKRIFFIIALLILGGTSLSTASTANAMPALKSVGEVTDAKGSVQLATGYWHWRKHYRRQLRVSTKNSLSMRSGIPCGRSDSIFAIAVDFPGSL